ncbi:MAG: hypothetical protein MZV49_09675 [Rhodopseudomonas palustris]|nr:hypothetical protein [Rhodopseudomonas palustris]
MAQLDPANHEQQHRLQREGGARRRATPTRRSVNDMYLLREDLLRPGRHADAVERGHLGDAAATPWRTRRTTATCIVRISGYNAYFVTLNREMQMELIERAEYGL